MRLFSRQLSDQEIIEGIRGGNPRRRFYENQLYDRFAYLIRDGSRKNRLTEEDCASIYSDTLLTVIDHITTGRFEGNSSLKTYTYRIFSNKCVDQIRKNTTKESSVTNTVSVDDMILQLPDTVQPAIQQLIAQQDRDTLRQRLRMLGDKCREMLMAWGEGYSDEEIAQTLGYHTSSVAKTSRLRCLERLRELYRTKTS